MQANAGCWIGGGSIGSGLWRRSCETTASAPDWGCRSRRDEDNLAAVNPAELAGVPITLFLEALFKWIFLGSLALMALTYWPRERLPDPEAFDRLLLEPPLQTATDRRPFTVAVRDQAYLITPRKDYVLTGVVVSSSNADALQNIWHHKSWKDFLNLRDLCVIWGENVTSGVYREMRFRNDSWTCWAYWPSAEVRSRFQMDALSNNHLLTDDPTLKSALMAARRGDQIRLSGVLAEYTNLGNGSFRGTSLTRDDTGDGACETIYLDAFEIVRVANVRERRLFDVAVWGAALGGIGFLIMLPIAPYRPRKRA